MGLGKLTKFFMDSFEVEIILDEKSGNGKTISEIGLFVKNPKGFKEDTPLLMAYRSFAGVPKTEEFSLVVHWVIGFLGLTTNVDDHYTGGFHSEPKYSKGVSFEGEGFKGSGGTSRY